MTQIVDGAALHRPMREASERRIRLVLVEDHTVVRDGLKALLELESDVEIVGEFGCGESGVDGIRGLQPDVVVTDLALPRGSGIALIGEIQRVSPRSRNLVLTGNDTEECIRAALSAGAHGYVMKDTNYGELLRAIRTVSMGERFLCSSTANKVLVAYLSGDKPPSSQTPDTSITVREREVLTRIAQGQSNKMIARALGLSPKTIEKHRANLMRKLQLHNAAAITVYAIQNGMDGGAPPAFRLQEGLPART
jgi:DNA-binding NarL/FixJ family response regulator